MCGLAGGVWKKPDDGMELRLSKALGRLRHRGPNDHGYDIIRTPPCTIALGQTRLSVIDIGAGGHQPMWNESKDLALIFNGEIYNYRELRDELRSGGYVFHSQSDTEVLLAAWHAWGRDCLLRLEGMFAFVIYDQRRQKLTSVRDGFGIKPLFFSADADSFIFASELPALLGLRAEAIKPNLQRSYDYLVHGDYDSKGQTFIDGVRHLPAGTLIELDLTSSSLSEPEIWWQAPVQPVTAISLDDAAESVRELFLRNVKLHLRSDVPLGAALSGGVDSSAVVCAMRTLEPNRPIHTFSYIADGALSEESWVDLVNTHVNAIPHKIRLGADDLIRDLDSIIATQGEPFGSTSIYAQYKVFRLAREHGITVTLDGQGADEVLGGYIGYPGERMLSMMETGRLIDMNRFAKAWGAWPGRSYRRAWTYFGGVALPDQIYRSAREAFGRKARPGWLDGDMLEQAGVNFNENQRLIRQSTGKGRRLAERLGYSLQSRGLPSLLRHGDRNSMASSIESRVPFLTIPFAKFMLSLPEHYLVSDEGETKHVFRRAMRGIVPDTILDRKDKIGFATPESNWFTQIAPSVRDWLNDAGAIPFLRREVLLAEFDAAVAERRLNWQVWRWINYVRWFHSLPGLAS